MNVSGKSSSFIQKKLYKKIFFPVASPDGNCFDRNPSIDNPL